VQKKKCRSLEDDLEESESARESLKSDINELNEKIIVLEEELYESKSI
jgi:predicted  nucleic acid-binding Zn-ribbon protein